MAILGERIDQIEIKFFDCFYPHLFAVDRLAASAVASGEIAALAHEARNHCKRDNFEEDWEEAERCRKVPKGAER